MPFLRFGMRRRWFLLTACVLVLLTSYGRAASAEADATAAAVLARFVDATGGAELHRRGSVQRHTGTVELAAMGVRGNITVLVGPPDRLAVSVELPDLDPFVQGTGGDAAWSIDAYNGPRLLGETQRVLMQLGLDPEEVADPAATFKSVKYIGREKVDVLGREVEADRLRIVTEEGVTVEEWFDVEAGFRVRRAATFETDFGPQVEETIFDDYRRVGESDLRVPFVTQRTVLGAPVKIVLDRVEVGVDLPADAFDPPAAVQKLLDAEAK